MAHQIDSIAYSGSTPWHQLGTRIPEDARRDFSASMTAAGLNWDVMTIPLFTGAGSQVEDAQGVIRLDTGRYLSTVGPDYTVIQNRDGLGIVEPLLDQGCTVEVMASLSGGRRTFALLRMPGEPVTVREGDDVRGYLLADTSHTGTSALRVSLTPIRVVCANTLQLAQNTAHTTAVTIRHTVSATVRVKDAKTLLTSMVDAFHAEGETFASMAQRELGPREIAEYLERVVPGRLDAKTGQLAQTVIDRRETIAELVFSGRGHQGDRQSGTASVWDAYNAVTEYFDHARRAEAKSPEGRTAAAESTLFGGNGRIKALALTAARQMVAA